MEENLEDVGEEGEREEKELLGEREFEKKEKRVGPADTPIDWESVYQDQRAKMEIYLERMEERKNLETNKWLRDYYPEVLQADELAFDEILHIYNKKIKKIGEFQLSVVRMDHLTNYEVFAEARHTSKKELPAECNMSMYGIVDMKFRTLREIRLEQEKNNQGQTTIKKVEWKKIPDYYNLKGLSIDENNVINVEENNYLPIKNMKRALSESAFIILLRQLAIFNFVGVLKFDLLFINGEKCPCNLHAGDIKIINYYFQPVKVKQFNKVVKCPNDKLQRSKILLTNTGILLYQEWSDTKIRLMLPLEARVFMDQTPPMDPRNMVPLRRRFHERFYLYNFYTDEYHKNLANFKNYFNDKPEAMNLVKFFLKEILLKKPHRVCHFAANYFCELL